MQQVSIRNKWVSLRGGSYVKDMDERDVFYVKGKFWTVTRKKSWSVHDRYFVQSFLGNLEITGSILGFDYHIILDGKEIGHVARKISLRDSLSYL